MNKKTKMLLGVAALGGAAILLLNQKKNFANAAGRPCKTVNGNLNTVWIGREIGGLIVTSTGNGTTTLCKKNTGIVDRLFGRMAAPSCKKYKGNVNSGFVGLCLDNGYEITETGNGQTTICKSNKCKM